MTSWFRDLIPKQRLQSGLVIYLSHKPNTIYGMELQREWITKIFLPDSMLGIYLHPLNPFAQVSTKASFLTALTAQEKEEEILGAAAVTDSSPPADCHLDLSRIIICEWIVPDGYSILKSIRNAKCQRCKTSTFPD